MRCTLPVVCLWAVLVLAAPLAARQATVVMNDGRQVQGTVVAETDTTLTLRIAEIDTPIAKDAIREVTFAQTVEEAYQAQRAQLKDEDLEGRFKLAQELYDSWSKSRDNAALLLAQKELDELASRFPEDGRVPALRNIIASRLKLQDTQAAKPEPSPTPTPSATEPTAAADPSLAGLPSERISEPDINLIRVFEVDMQSPNKPRITATRELRDRVLKDYADNDATPKGRTAQARFFSAQGHEVLSLLFKLRAREMYGEVTVHDDPPALRTFKQNVHSRFVLNYCGTNECHGGKNAGALFLFRAQPASDATVYSNFYALHAYSNASGVMIDRESPQSSLLLNYALPTNLSRVPHPSGAAVPGWKPLLRSLDDPNAQMLVRWVESLYRPEPNYGVQYTPPSLKPAEAPPSPVPDPAPVPQQIVP